MHDQPEGDARAVDHHDFSQRVLEASRDRPILVDFWADWCAPCITLSPLLDRVAEEYGGRFHLRKVEVDEGDNMKLAGHYKLRGFPTCILFVDGEELARFASHRPLHWLREFLDEHLPGAS